MTFSWRRKKGATKKNDMELTIPAHFRCPISLDLMKDPVTLSTGITYDRESIDKWIQSGNQTCPVTNQILKNLDIIPNHSIRKMIQDWCVANKSNGVQRIPTPRIPITPYQVSDLCSRINTATISKDEQKCFEFIRKMKNLAKESEGNKRCIVENGIGLVLADMLVCFSNLNLLKEVLSALVWTFPLDKETASKLNSHASLRSITRFLETNGDLSSRQNAICVLKQVLHTDPTCLDTLMATSEGIEETLFQIIKVPIGPKPTKASLFIIYQMMSKSHITTSNFIQMGILSPILHLLIDGDKSISERALAVLDAICSCQQGKEQACENPLTIPLLVKKILRVSNAASELCISTLWKLCSGKNEAAVIEAAQLGAFQKLLVVLQIGSSDRIREQVTDLLKLMNMYKGRVDCFDSSAGFKYVKRSN